MLVITVTSFIASLHSFLMSANGHTDIQVNKYNI